MPLGKVQHIKKAHICIFGSAVAFVGGLGWGGRVGLINFEKNTMLYCKMVVGTIESISCKELMTHFLLSVKKLKAFLAIHLPLEVQWVDCGMACQRIYSMSSAFNALL